MELAFLIYIIDVFCHGKDNGYALAGAILLIVWSMGFAVSVAWKMTPKEENSIEYLKVYSSLWPLKTMCIVLIVAAFIIPSKQTAYTMVAAYGVQSIAESEKVQQLGSKSLEMIEQYMNNYLEENKSDAKAN